MLPHLALVASLLPLSQAAETVIGVYIFSRHGDRTSKSTPPTNVTDLGYQEVFASGTYYRNRYIANGASNQISGISADIANFAQIATSAPLDTVLFPSSIGFLQGLYPPVGEGFGSQTLRNGTTIQTPLNGYQLIPVATITTGTASENSAWLQGQSNCADALTSSNEYLFTDEYATLLNNTKSFYTSLAPLINATFASSAINYKSAYTIFDLLNVAQIHNASFDPTGILTDSTFHQVQTLADAHEFGLAYNASSPVRAIAGSVLAAQVVQGLNATAVAPKSSSAPKINIQFGAYGAFQSFFGLANLTQADPDFYGIPDYASTMAFELFTNSTSTAANDLNVRFLFHNGTAKNETAPTAYPLFGQSSPVLSWNDFLAGMDKFAVGSQSAWCQACGNTTGVCASASTTSSPGAAMTSAASSSDSSQSGGGMSLAVAGVVGAMVTLAVILGIEALIMLIGGFRLVSKKRQRSSAVTAEMSDLNGKS